MTEDILEPDLPIIDPHHHLWDLAPAIAALAGLDHPFLSAVKKRPLYLMDELGADARAGHNIVATVYMECGSFYRSEGPEAMKPVGEVEFVTQLAEEAAAEPDTGFRPCAGIVGHADLSLGGNVAAVLEAEIEAGRGRFKGIRHATSHDDDPEVFSFLDQTFTGFMGSDEFRKGFAELGKLGLSFDAWCGEPQMLEVLDLAHAFPDTPIILDHVGTPLGIARYKSMRDQRFPLWRKMIRELAKCDNVSVKLGGLGMPYLGLPDIAGGAQPTSAELAAIWKPYIETCIEAFGVDRAMFESNFPVDYWVGDYVTVWNAFKRLAQGASNSEKAALFSGTAAKVYGLEGV